MTLRTIDFYAAHLPKGSDNADRLRIARAHADNAGWYFQWSDDWDVQDHVAEYPNAYDAQPGTCEQVDLFDANGKLLSSLGCIDDADQDYRDLIEAERALEAMEDDSECGHCGRTWNSVLTPTPSPRCPFEYDHEPDDESETPAIPDGDDDDWEPRYWWLNVTSDSDQPQPFAETFGICDEDAGGYVAYVGSVETADEWCRVMNEAHHPDPRI